MLRGLPSIPRPKICGQTRTTAIHYPRSLPHHTLININRRFFVSHKDENDITKIPMSPLVEGRTHRAAIPPATVQQISGMPADSVHKRKLVIYKPSRNAMQSGTRKTKKWRAEWEQEPKIDTPLMGWMGSRDAYACLRMDFDTLDAAISMAESSGYPYEVREETNTTTQIQPKSYADNFAYVPPHSPNANLAEFEEDIARMKK